SISHTMDLPQTTKRISVSLPGSVYQALDGIIQKQGFENRSQAIAEIIMARNSQLEQETGNEITAGVITLVYDVTKGNIQRELADLQREHIDEVISTLSVLLEDDYVMEVMIVQGPGRKLRALANKFISRKGVRTGKMTMASQIMPPIHPLPQSRLEEETPENPYAPPV
ncbi:nickel-responsive transcriptional regulator NikR, partial [Verrucomicrobiales bacterium]|nr:nickel-responsive transcriptional regulator NikR [Verrucomicrobiales bacterium]